MRKLRSALMQQMSGLKTQKDEKLDKDNPNAVKFKMKYYRGEALE